MTSSSNPSRSENQDDPWEQLAEDLFGLEYGKEHAAHEAPAPAVESTGAAEPESPAESAAPIRAERSEGGRTEEPPRFASEAAAAAERPIVEEPRAPGPAVSDVIGDFEAAAESPAEAVPEPAKAAPASPQDSYWDALANWNWDESDGGGAKARSEQPASGPARSQGGPPARGGARGRDESRGRDEGRGRRGGERPPRQSAGSAPSAGPSGPAARSSREPAPVSADDFGLGVDDEEPGFSPPAESAAAETRAAQPSRPEGAAASERAGRQAGERGAEAGEESEFPRKRRRRRRRRRGRGGEGETAGSPAMAGAEGESSEAEAPEDEAELVFEDEGEEAGEDFGEERAAPPPRGRRAGRDRDDERRRAAGRRANRFEEDEQEPVEIIEAGGAPESADEASGGEDEEGEEQVVNYEDVPTWEEAISYLLHPNQVQVETGSGGANPARGAPPADQPRQTRHIGHRKHRR